VAAADQGDDGELSSRPDATPRQAGPEAAGSDRPARVTSREPVSPGDEAELARRLSNGDPDALTAVAKWLWEPLAAYAFRILEDRDAAMDVAQEACLRLWDRRGRDSPHSIRSYLFRIARNLALDHLKTKRTRRGLLGRHDPTGARRPAWPDEVLRGDRIADEVQRAIQALPDRRREVFALTYLQGLKYAEVAEVMGISPKTVQNHLSAALAQLRLALRPVLEDRRDHGDGRVDWR
jgi:RNA polymerase sigma-70 factor (ECF subfamily)